MTRFIIIISISSSLSSHIIPSSQARDTLLEFVVPADAKAGTVAPKDVVLPTGPTGLEPSQTSFFQAMNIPTKIVKGAY